MKLTEYQKEILDGLDKLESDPEANVPGLIFDEIRLILSHPTLKNAFSNYQKDSTKAGQYFHIRSLVQR